MKTITYDETKWKLVPVEPTPEMVKAMAAAYLDQHGYADAFIKAMYASAIAAAPAPAAQTQAEGGA